MNMDVSHQRGRRLTTQDRLDDMDSAKRQGYDDLRDRFNRGKFESVKDLLKMVGQVAVALWDDIVDHRKADVMLRAIRDAAAMQRVYLELDFPNEILGQFNEEFDKYKASVAKVHKELLCPECYKKVSEKLGWS